MEHIILHLRAWADDVDVDDGKVKSIGENFLYIAAFLRLKAGHASYIPDWPFNFEMTLDPCFDLRKGLLFKE